ncbi:MAG: hypothetical protein WDW36_002107 [Sanguina aurantia]
MRHIDRQSVGVSGGKANTAPLKGSRNASSSSSNVYALLSNDDVEAGDDHGPSNNARNRDPRNSGSFILAAGGDATLRGSSGDPAWQNQRPKPPDTKGHSSAAAGAQPQQPKSDQRRSWEHSGSLYTSGLSDYNRAGNGIGEGGAYAPRRETGTHPAAGYGGLERGEAPATAWQQSDSSSGVGREDAQGEWQLRKSLALLVLLYHMQGIPLGLTLGSLPFMLQSKLSYTQIGLFSMAAYPYSLKLLWSPVVDSVYSARVGRRKSWVIPMQLMISGMMILYSEYIQQRFEAADVWSLTLLFFVLVFLVATQDIAVDGWALTLLPPKHVAYASTCQTIGTSSGYFTSFTVFLALSNAEFCNTYLRGSGGFAGLLHLQPSDHGMVTLAGYLRFWGWLFAATTVLLALFKREDNASSSEGPDADVTCAPTSALLHALASDSAASSYLSNNGNPSGTLQQQLHQQRDPASTTPTPGPKSSAAAGDSRESGGSNSTGLKAAPPAAPQPSGRSRARNQIQNQVFGSSGAPPRSGPPQGGSPPQQQPMLHALRDAYLQLWGVTRLPAVWKLTAFLLTSRLGILAAEGAASLKLIDKGVSKEALATLVLLQFPVELATALAAGRWAARTSPARPFLVGYGLRLVAAALTVWLVAVFPSGAGPMSEHPLHFAALAVLSLATSCFSTLCFTALGSFFNGISDPLMGGAYLTLLNTITNMGYMLPRTPIFALMDVLTRSSCLAPDGITDLQLTCPTKPKDLLGPSPCTTAGGVCSMESDGFYIVAWVTLAIGTLFGVAYFQQLPALFALPLHSWRVSMGQTGRGSKLKS